MNAFKFSILNLLIILLVACGDMDRNKGPLFAIQLEGREFKQNESVAVAIKNNNNMTINKVSYFIDGKALVATGGNLVLDTDQLGNKTLHAKVDYEGGSEEISKKIKIFAPEAPKVYGYEIINEYPHDTKAYTQGLEFHDGVLYESTGKRGRSSLRKVAYKSGKVEKQVDLDRTIFGEGITILNDKIFMLSWQGKTGFIYNLSDLSKIDNFQYGESTEGWGLANNGKKLIKSDGTEKIWFLNPDTLIEEGFIQTVTHKSIVNSANELEYVDGKIYANVYQKPSVMIIDATSGAIEGVVNFGGLLKEITKHANWSDTDHVLNGIAYHPERKTFFVTGKEWDKVFEVNIVKKE